MTRHGSKFQPPPLAGVRGIRTTESAEPQAGREIPTPARAKQQSKPMVGATMVTQEGAPSWGTLGEVFDDVDTYSCAQPREAYVEGLLRSRSLHSISSPDMLRSSAIWQSSPTLISPRTGHREDCSKRDF